MSGQFRRLKTADHLLPSGQQSADEMEHNSGRCAAAASRCLSHTVTKPAAATSAEVLQEKASLPDEQPPKHPRLALPQQRP